jgi:[CysO sulfur-carrier protein]-S-L-cysteine hydrolase
MEPFRLISSPAMLGLSADAHAGMIGHAYDCYPEEMCGLLAGRPGADEASRFYPCENSTHSGKVYTVSPKDHLRADRDADDHGLEIIGVVHSHTHTEPYPSVTDVTQAPDPAWHYVIVGLKRHQPETRSYRIVDGAITEEQITVR